MKRKRTFTLIEMILSLSLLAILLTSLFFWYGRLSSQKDDFYRCALEERYLFQRLNKTFIKTDLPFASLSKDDLVFQFESGLSRDPLLSGKVLARLYHDKTERQLCLGIWPALSDEVQRSPSQKHVLLNNVEDIAFEFYSPPPVDSKTVEIEDIDIPRPLPGWQNQWAAAYKELPAMIKCMISRKFPKKNRKVSYIFELPSEIRYPKETID